MTVAITLALALALSHPAPIDIVVGDIGSRAFVVKGVSFERSTGDSQVIRAWLCRRAPGMPLRRVAVIAEDAAGNVIWKDVIATPAFAPRRSRECRVLRIEAPASVGSEATLWRMERP